MPRVLWKGAISFGLVHIPVGLYSAVNRNELSFTLLDKNDLAPVGYKRINKESGKEVNWDDIVKGYEYEDGRYVLLSDEDLRRANVEATQTIDIVAFVEAADISLIYYDTPYYLAPGKRADKSYALLRETLRRAGRVGLASVVIRSKQHLAALVPMGEMLVLNTLRRADEIKPHDDFKLPGEDLENIGLSEKEITMALALVEGMSEEWDPAHYPDTYRDDVLAMIEEKIASGETHRVTEPEEEEATEIGPEVTDLMAMLKRSIEAKTQGKRPAKRPAKPAAQAVGEAEETGEEAKPKSRAKATRPQNDTGATRRRATKPAPSKDEPATSGGRKC